MRNGLCVDKRPLSTSNAGSATDGIGRFSAQDPVRNQIFSAVRHLEADLCCWARSLEPAPLVRYQARSRERDDDMRNQHGGRSSLARAH